MYDKKNSVLFTDTGCFVMSFDFKLIDESQVLLKVPRKNNMYSVDMKNIVPKESLTCLVTKVTLNESMIWHRRLGHINFKNINKLVKDNQTCVACLKGKQYKASYLLGFFFFNTNDETSGILKSFITEIENLVDKKVKIIRFDNGTKFKNRNRGHPKKEDQGYVDNGFLRHMTRNMSYLSDFKEFDGGYVTFGGGAKGGKITGIGTLKTGTEESIGAGHSSKETRSSQDYILMPLWKDGSLFDSSSKNASNDEPQPSSDAGKKDDEGVNKESGIDDQERLKNSTQDVNTARPSINTASTNVNTDSLNINTVSPTITTATLEATHADFFGDETEVDMSNITTTYLVPSTLNTRIHKDHSLDHVIGDVQTRRMTKTTNEEGFISVVYEGKTREDLHTCLFACFLSQEEPYKVIQVLKDPSWIEAMQEELLQFKLQQVWTLVDLPHGKRAIGTKWVYRNKKDERGIVIRNKARLVVQGYTQEEGIDYDEVFAPVARIEAIRLFLAYASFKDFVVYQMDVKSAFLYGKIKEEVYICQPPVFEDPEFPDRVYKVEKALYGLHQAPRAWYETFSTYVLDNGFQRGQIDKTLFIKRVKSDILLVQVYVDDIIFGSTKKELCTEFEKLMHKKF
ncbi:putative ribonuclease H-like domain-containing protein [Tanacetum coccineum]